MPVVSSSSPPDSHGVGSGSSEMCTQRTGVSSCSSPASSLTSRSPMSSRTESISPTSASYVHTLGRLGQDWPQDRFDLLELRRPADERRRELDDRIAAIVGAADEPTPE